MGLILSSLACTDATVRSQQNQPSPAAVPPTAASPSAPDDGLRAELVTDELDGPVYVAAPPGSESFYVVQRDGRIVEVVEGRVVPFLDISASVRTEVEEGFHSIAFHPRFESNGLFYIYYNDLRGDIRIEEWSSTRSLRPHKVRDILTVNKPRVVRHHNGGQLQFGPDGALYTATGDAARNPYDGGPNPPGVVDPRNNAQNIDTPYGKLYRIDVDSEEPRPEMVGYGLRNPWRFSFDRRSRRLYVADNGQFQWEEVDAVRIPITQLLNFGWSAYEGRQPYIRKRLNPTGKLIEPVYVYEHDVGPLYCPGNGSIVGGYVYRGSAAPSLAGRYVFGDFCSGEVFSFDINDKSARTRTEEVRISGLVSFGLDAEGELYAVSLVEDSLYRFEE